MSVYLYNGGKDPLKRWIANNPYAGAWPTPIEAARARLRNKASQQHPSEARVQRKRQKRPEGAEGGIIVSPTLSQEDRPRIPLYKLKKQGTDCSVPLIEHKGGLDEADWHLQVSPGNRYRREGDEWYVTAEETMAEIASKLSHADYEIDAAEIIGINQHNHKKRLTPETHLKEHTHLEIPSEPMWQEDGHRWIGCYVDVYKVVHTDPVYNLPPDNPSGRVNGRNMIGQIVAFAPATKNEPPLWKVCYLDEDEDLEEGEVGPAILDSVGSDQAELQEPQEYAQLKHAISRVCDPVANPQVARAVQGAWFAAEEQLRQKGDSMNLAASAVAELVDADVVQQDLAAAREAAEKADAAALSASQAKQVTASENEANHDVAAERRQEAVKAATILRPLEELALSGTESSITLFARQEASRLADEAKEAEEAAARSATALHERQVAAHAAEQAAKDAAAMLAAREATAAQLQGEAQTRQGAYVAAKAALDEAQAKHQSLKLVIEHAGLPEQPDAWVVGHDSVCHPAPYADGSSSKLAQLEAENTRLKSELGAFTQRYSEELHEVDTSNVTQFIPSDKFESPQEVAEKKRQMVEEAQTNAKRVKIEKRNATTLTNDNIFIIESSGSPDN